MEIYLIHDRERDRHKIGISVDPVRRLRQLQTGNAGLLSLVDHYPTTRARRIESTLHGFYSANREMGEWFDMPAGEVGRFQERCQFFEDFHQRREPAYQLADF